MDEPRYTAMEWAAMEGGHEITPVEKPFSFINGLYEEGLVEKAKYEDKKLDEDAWADIRARRIERLNRDRNVALYGYLVGIDNAIKAIKAAELAEEGKGIPPQFVKAYAPIFEMIDDFINAGASGVQRLKQAHKSIKKRR